MMDILDFSEEENNNGNNQNENKNNNQKQIQYEKMSSNEGWNSPSPPRHSHINDSGKNNDKKSRLNESPRKRTSTHSDCANKNKNYENSLYNDDNNNKRPFKPHVINQSFKQTQSNATKNYQNSNKVLIRSQSSHCFRGSSNQISSTFKRDLGADYRNQRPPNFNKYNFSYNSNNNKFRSTARFNNGYSVTKNLSKNFMKPVNTILPKFKWNTNINSNIQNSSFNTNYYNYKYRLNDNSVKIGSFQSENSNTFKNYVDKSTKQIPAEQEQRINTTNNNDHKEQKKEAERENSSMDFYFQIKIVNSYREFCQIKTKNIFSFPSTIETISFLKSLSNNSNPAINTISQPVILFLDGTEQIFYGAGVVCLKEFSEMNNKIDTNLIESMNFRINWIYLSEIEVSEIYNLQKNDLQDSKQIESSTGLDILKLMEQNETQLHVMKKLKPPPLTLLKLKIDRLVELEEFFELKASKITDAMDVKKKIEIHLDQEEKVDLVSVPFEPLADEPEIIVSVESIQVFEPIITKSEPDDDDFFADYE